MKRAGIFLFFDPQGLVDDYIVECLTSLREYLDEILVVSNSPLDDTARERLLKGATEVFERENTGFDVGGYRDGIARFGWDRLGQIDELILFNYTFFAPVNPWKNLFDRVDAAGAVDFWGITEHDEVRPHPFLAATRMPRHIQSHWIAVRNPLLSSPDFRKYWDEMPPIRSYNDSIQWHESRFTEYFGNLGYTHVVAYPREDYPSRNPVFDNASMLLAIVGADMLELAARSGYDTDLILTNLARTSKPRDLVTNAGLTTVVPPFAAPQAREKAASLRVAAIAHIFYADMADEIIDRLSALPDGWRLVATTADE
ncbi:MAG: rhamnan synthesis protein F, partial [Thermobifida sp.]|nr:rhamnan synthesis protein F [Thermobifida sp.]